MFCKITDCLRPVENEDTGLCATHNRQERKLNQKWERHDAHKERIAIIRTIIKQRSARRAKEETQYKRRVKEWKKDKMCALTGHSECDGVLTCHHQKGRIGDLLLDERYWLPVCAKHHYYIETHPQEAYERGWSLLRNANEPHEIKKFK